MSNTDEENAAYEAWDAAMRAPLTAEEVEAIREAIDVLDDLWDFDAARGKCDGRDGSEYKSYSVAFPLVRLLRAHGLGPVPEKTPTYKPPFMGAVDKEGRPVRAPF